MILAIDVGNSFVKCAVVDADRVLGRESIATKTCENTTQLDDMVRRVSGTVLSIEKAIVSSVVPSITARAVSATERGMGMKPQVVDCKMHLPFDLAVALPSQVGADRLCAAAGAVALNRRNAIVVDAGSAVTVDAVKNGSFLGGIIAAGPSIALRGLHQYASQLPAIDLSRASEPFPKTFDTTETAMTLGATVGCAGAIRELVRYLEAALGNRPKKYVTGGLGGLFAPRLPQSWYFDPDLTLKGLYVIASLNRRESD
jgi:type III pantothenate kinase